MYRHNYFTTDYLTTSETSVNLLMNLPNRAIMKFSILYGNDVCDDGRSAGSGRTEDGEMKVI